MYHYDSWRTSDDDDDDDNDGYASKNSIRMMLKIKLCGLSS